MNKALDKRDKKFGIYLSWDNQEERKQKQKSLSSFLAELGVSRRYTIKNAACGVVLNFEDQEDADKFDGAGVKKLTDALGLVNTLNIKPSCTPVSYKQGVFLRDVPWNLPLEELKGALNQQGISSARLERKKQYVRVEVTEPEHYESLLRNGLNFLNLTTYAASPDRHGRTSESWHNRQSNLKNDSSYIMQCYKCQGWWHTAQRCRYETRCVRCGGQHTSDHCKRTRAEAVCCHCSGPHPASDKNCPVRLSLINAVPATLTVTSDPEIPYNPFQHVL